KCGINRTKVQIPYHISEMAELQIIKYDCLVKKILIEITAKPSSGFDGHWNIAPIRALYNLKAATS
ncbi:MAG: hypothetical protein ABUJ92_13510, partial [Desulfobacterales bacterium]